MSAPRLRGARGRLGAALLGLLTAAMVLAPNLSPASADTLSDKQNQRQQLNSLMQHLRDQIKSAQDQEAALQNAITVLDGQIAQTEQDINTQQDKLDRIGADLATAQGELAQTRAKLATDKQELAQQLVYIYKQSNNSTINQVLGSSSFNELWQKLIDLRRVAASQQTTLKTVQDEEARVNALVASIARQQAEQKQVLAQLHDQAANLQAELSARQDAADQLAQVQAQDQQRLAEAEQSAKELDAQIQELQAEAAAAARRGGGNGHFVWPESGPITQGFGCTPYQFEPWDPNCPSHHFHTGIDIGAAWGTPVGAGDAGIAHTYVSSYGYGNHVIIVHGNGWVSIYGHLASFAVSDGQAVARGQTIGYEGSTGNSTGPHLHFEIRLNDVPQNPLQYLP